MGLQNDKSSVKFFWLEKVKISDSAHQLWVLKKLIWCDISH